MFSLYVNQFITTTVECCRYKKQELEEKITPMVTPTFCIVGTRYAQTLSGVTVVRLRFSVIPPFTY